MLQRRTFLAAGLAALADLGSVRAEVPPGPPASGTAARAASPIAALVRQRAELLSHAPFEAPVERLPPALASIGYDEYRDIRFRPEHALWRGEDLGFEVQFFLAAYLYRSPVEIFLVDGGRIRPLTPSRTQFDFGPQRDKVPPGAPLAFSGFRIHAPLSRPDYYDELIVFQGASYFRALGKAHSYGLSARALALGTGGAEPEEFPLLRSFWIERPRDSLAVTVHGLLDSPSVTGAFTFVIAPGTATVMDVDAWLYPRRDLTHVGLAPLTSMFLKDMHDPGAAGDFRPAIHDSDGLAVLNGQGEHLWRPLVNPPRLQTSCLRDDNPKGFGLMQRERRFEAYQDLEARYQDRPSLWVEPMGDWGPGCVQLVEIPTDAEYFDNIAAFWRPDDALEAGVAHRFAYRLAWRDDTPLAEIYRVAATRIGHGGKAGQVRFVVDFREPETGGPAGLQEVASVVVSDVPLRPLPEAELSATAGRAGAPRLERNPFTPGVRVSFDFDPGPSEESELRLSLFDAAGTASEVWLLRWHR